MGEVPLLVAMAAAVVVSQAAVKEKDPLKLASALRTGMGVFQTLPPRLQSTVGDLATRIQGYIEAGEEVVIGAGVTRDDALEHGRAQGFGVPRQ